MSSTNATPVQRRSGAGYLCCFCTQVFSKMPLLKKHTIDDHQNKADFMKDTPLSSFLVKLDITDLKCNLCAQDFATLDQVTAHLTKEHNKNFYSDIKNQTAPFRLVEDVIQCGVCPSKFRSFKLMLEHMNGHFPNHVCEICGKGYLNKNNLHAHSIRHASPGDFQCANCDKVFDTRVKKRDHENAVHKRNNMRNKCGFCDERFNDYVKKQKHEVTTHGAEPVVLQCTACEKTFDNQRALNAHTKKHHVVTSR